MRIVRQVEIVEYDTVPEMKEGNRQRNADKWTVIGKHAASGKFYVYYRKQVPFKDRVESFPVVFTKKGYANFLQGKVYEARARYVDGFGNPSYYQITDEDGDPYRIGDTPHKLERGWELYVEEE